MSRSLWLGFSIIAVASFWASPLQAPAAIAASGQVLAAQTATLTPPANASTVAAPTAVAKGKVAVPASAPFITYVPAGLAASTPAIAQGNFLGGYGCAPTALAMVMGYFHNLNSAYGAATPQELVGPGDFIVGQGVPYNNMTDSMNALGYHSLSGTTGISMATLSSKLNQGPVIATVGIAPVAGQLVPGSIQHSIVVVGVSTDGSRVLVNDPWVGRQLSLTTAQFLSLWQRGQNGIALIRP